MSEFDARMAQLRTRFVARAQEDRDKLQTAADAKDRSEIVRIAHGLSGSAGVFGFPELGLVAQGVEEEVEAAKDAEVDTLCAGLLRSLAEIAQED